MAQQAQSKGRGPSGGGSLGGEPGSTKKSKNVKDMAGRQKAAVFLVALGSDISAEIFKHLREDEIETLTFEIAAWTPWSRSSGIRSSPSSKSS